MMTPKEMAEDIVRREGGYNDVPGDKGGATNHGVSLRYAKGIGLDLDGDGDTDKDDIRLVTPEKAVELYLEDFLTDPRINRLPDELQPQLFDAAVNHGPPRAIMWVQHLVGAEVDGVIGPETRAKTEAEVRDHGWEGLNDAIVELRRTYFRSLAAGDPTQRKFLKGWLTRADSFLSKNRPADTSPGLER